MSVIIRNFRCEDYDSILTFEQKLILSPKLKSSGFIISPLSLDALEELAENGICLVAEMNNSVVGVLASGLTSAKALSYLFDDLPKVEWINHAAIDINKIFWLERISVSQEHQYQGIGLKLMEELFASVKQSIYSAVVSSPTNNLPAKQFYAKNGFQIVGRYKNTEFRGAKDYESAILFRESVS